MTRSFILFLVSLAAWLELQAESAILIRNVRLVDGTGAPAYAGALRFADGRITAVGPEIEAQPGDEVRDGGGLVLAPGFIDPHSHHDRKMGHRPTIDEQASQGVTTIVVGQDGSSVHPLAELWRRLEKQPVALNVASYSGHNTIRRVTMGADFKRRARDEEVATMATLLEADLAAGSWGLSTGLAYDPGNYSDTPEVLRLARVAAAHGGRYISHMRRENISGFWAAVDEVLLIGRETGMPVQISHTKMGGVSLWGKAPQLLAKLDAARREGILVTADVYPYVNWQSTLTVLLPKRDFHDYAAAYFAMKDLTTPEGMILSEFEAEPALVGKSIAQIAAERGGDPIQVYLDLINQAQAAKAREGVIGTSMREEDIAALLQWPFMSVCSDGAMEDLHPRGAGSFAKILRQQVRENRVLTLEEAVRKMSGLVADQLGFVDRGYLRPGLAADLVLFDPATIADHATMEHPGALATGVAAVWVNGRLVWRDGRPTGALPGLALKRPSSVPFVPRAARLP